MLSKRTCFFLLMLLAVPALVLGGVPKKISPDSKLNHTYSAPANSGRDVFEGFENEFPPTGWRTEVTNEASTWYKRGDAWGYEGLFAAACDWNASVPQDEKLGFEQVVDVAGGEYVLSFWTAGSTGQSWDFNATETVEINGVEVWNFDEEVNYGHHFEYQHFFIDLSEYDGQTVTIDFRYVGMDGDTHFFDAVMVDDGTGWTGPPLPPGPDNDTCEGAWENGYVIPPGAFTLVGDNTTAYHDYALVGGSCISYGFHGLDLVWAVCMEEGDVLDVEMIGQAAGFDAVFFLVSDCADPTGSCLVGGDEPEVINYTATEAGTYYLICGGWTNAMVAEFSLVGILDGAGCGTVATDSENWDSLKALYR